ncbi:hypothetical protein PHYSODRAFT_336673 [Phytophthora sojae]|uniref:Uncharacterized protein n=1 Tax=Phytophthora sojae (strain P6497) TaxID=1094619 RepID=G4ZVI7_PHYSP|nr:hypothetical protein PHYSODRAFT_336673 [Phytophthora sojae]EGZ12226.1 hypothetical protein PHYSODRAFT_336673 [Phytophthora sojae]|eukprot:XP_009532559.1 hypothetical protein PHYSODRAFT_336673 [Phytophthora sojae]
MTQQSVRHHVRLLLPEFFAGLASRRHDQASVILWIDNPEVETSLLLGIAASGGNSEYIGKAPAPAECFINGFTPNLIRTLDTFPHIDCTLEKVGSPQSLIIWDQMTDAARATLSTADFGKAQVPFNEYNFIKRLDEAAPF